MQFCKECGGALNFFETNDEEVCWNCVRRREQAQPPPPPRPQPEEPDDLAGATLCCENSMLVLKSREGWVLWSGPADQPAGLEAILSRARHIYQVRRKRQRNKN